jgi:hypothetical protein
METPEDARSRHDNVSEGVIDACQGDHRAGHKPNHLVAASILLICGIPASGAKSSRICLWTTAGDDP